MLKLCLLHPQHFPAQKRQTRAHKIVRAGNICRKSSRGFLSTSSYIQYK